MGDVEESAEEERAHQEDGKEFIAVNPLHQ
jgi:hypothetical protein